jgi:hypothetical protein
MDRSGCFVQAWQLCSLGCEVVEGCAGYAPIATASFMVKALSRSHLRAEGLGAATVARMLAGNGDQSPIALSNLG